MPYELRTRNARQLIDSLDYYLDGNWLERKALGFRITHIVVHALLRGEMHPAGIERSRRAEPCSVRRYAASILSYAAQRRSLIIDMLHCASLNSNASAMT